MKNLSALLQRFSSLLDKKLVIRETVSLVITDYTGRKIPVEEVFIKGTTLEIQSSPATKNEIRLKEEKIISELRNSHNLHISRVLYK